jgi:hypothetical protein
MPPPSLRDQLTTLEAQEIQGMLGDQTLMSGLRKVWAEQSSYWLNQLKLAALAKEKNTGLMVEAAARADAAEESEQVIILSMKR